MSISGSAAREVLMIQTEAAFNSPAAITTSPTAIAPKILGDSGLTYPMQTSYTLASDISGYNAMYLRLDGGNAFSMRPMPIREEIMWGGGLAIPSQNVSGHFEMRGRLTTKLYASQAELLLSWAGKRYDGLSSPWAETGVPTGDLCSCTIYHGAQQDALNYKWRIYCGCKIGSWTLAVSRDAQVATFSCDIVGCIPIGTGLLNLYAVSLPFTLNTATYPGLGTADIAVTLPSNSATNFFSPKDAFYPNDPYIFVHTANNLSMYPSTVSSAKRTNYSSLSLSSTNTIDLRTFENPWPTVAQFTGRRNTMTGKFFYKKQPNSTDASAYPDDRAQMEGVKAQTITLNLQNGTGTHNVATLINMRTANIYSAVDDDFPLDRVHEQTVTASNVMDTATPSGQSDIDFTFTKS